MKTLRNILTMSFLLSVLAACGGNPTVDEDLGGADDGSAASTQGAGYDDGFDSDSDGMNADGANGELATVFYFDYDRSTLTYETRQLLDRHADILKNSSRVVRLEGHADDRGTREYNLALGERRAKSIADYLVLQGVPRSQIETISYGEEKPIAFSQDEEAFRLNRRVELK